MSARILAMMSLARLPSLNDRGHRGPRLVQVGFGQGHPAEAGIAIRHDGGERLVYLMSD